MLSYEDLILNHQNSTRDDCTNCEHLNECRTGKRNNCVMNEVQEMYNPNLSKAKGAII